MVWFAIFTFYRRREVDGPTRLNGTNANKHRKCLRDACTTTTTRNCACPTTFRYLLVNNNGYWSRKSAPEANQAGRIQVWLSDSMDWEISTTNFGGCRGQWRDGITSRGHCGRWKLAQSNPLWSTGNWKGKNMRIDFFLVYMSYTHLLTLFLVSSTCSRR